MAQETEQARRGLDAIAGVAREAARKGPPPVHLWNPPFCGDLDMRIASDGTWFYLKTPIGRAALVKLFASVLRREGDKYFLVTPVEKCGITVEDAPFLAVELRAEQADHGRVLHFRTNVDDWVACDRDHALRFEREAETGGLKPYLHVRRNLWAKVTRALFYDLAELDEIVEQRARHLSPEIAADVEVRLKAASFRLGLEAQRVLAPARHPVIDIGAEMQQLALLSPLRLELDREERRVLDGVAAFLHRRDQEILVAFAFEHRSEQLHQRRSPDRGLEIEPSAIGRDTHV